MSDATVLIIILLSGIFLFYVFSLPYKAARANSTPTRSKLIVSTELQLASTELDEHRKTLRMIEYRHSRISYSSYPRRYYDIKRKIDNLPTKISQLEVELANAPNHSFGDYVDQSDKSYLQSQKASILSQLGYIKDELNMMSDYDGKGKPRGWHEATEKKILLESKLAILESQSDYLTSIERRRYGNLFSS